jgi:GNAT superfamily N-acetyltransferase
MGGSDAARGRVEVHPPRSVSEEQAAGEVTVAAYEEFRSRFLPDDWAEYAKTLPDTAVRREQGQLLVATEPDGDVVGTVTFYLEPQPTSGHWRADDAVLRFLAVRPDRRGAGVGATLLEDCLRRAREAGKRRVALQTTAYMTAAIAMYEHRGFVRDPAGDMVAGSFVLEGYALELSGAGAAG